MIGRILDWIGTFAVLATVASLPVGLLVLFFGEDAVGWPITVSLLLVALGCFAFTAWTRNMGFWSAVADRITGWMVAFSVLATVVSVPIGLLLFFFGQDAVAWVLPVSLVLVAVGYFAVTTRNGNMGFWSAVTQNPEFAARFFRGDPTWFIDRKPSDREVVGPFRFADPILGRRISLWADPDTLDRSQKAFMAGLKSYLKRRL